VTIGTDSTDLDKTYSLGLAHGNSPTELRASLRWHLR